MRKGPWYQMGKALDYGSFGVDDRPDRLPNVSDEVLAAIDGEDRKTLPRRGKRHGSAALTGRLRAA